MTDAVVIRPCTDAVERILSLWLDLLLPPGTGRPGVTVLTDLQGSAPATPAAVQAALAGGDVVLYFGHGTETTLGIPTLVDTVTIASAHGQVLVAVACLAADTFGPSAVRGTHLSTFLGFSEPLFLHTAQPGLFGYEISVRMGGYLTGASTLTQAATDLTADLKAIEALYRTGAGATHADAPLVWMGTRMNWRGLEVH